MLESLCRNVFGIRYCRAEGGPTAPFRKVAYRRNTFQKYMTRRESQ